MKIVATVLIALTITISTFGQAPAAQSCSSAQEPLVGAFRVINTAQLRFYGANHRYANLAELLSFDETKKLSSNPRYAQPVPKSVALTTSDDPLPGYDLRVTIASDGKSYVIAATKKDGNCKLAGAMTDERGVIYMVEPLR